MFGMAAIAIPIVLHLIAKREPKRVVFPSVRFLTKRFESNRSRLRVRRWWLLAMRIAALAAIALALARPAIHRSLSLTWTTIGMLVAFGIALLVMASVSLFKEMSKGLTYGLAGLGSLCLLCSMLWGAYTYFSGPAPILDDATPVAIAIVLDNSPTSGWKTADDDRIDRMKSVANWMITRLPPTSRIAIVDRSGTPAAFALDVASAVSKVDSLKPAELTNSIASKVDAAVRLLRTSELESRQVLIVSDLTNPTWQESIADTSLVSLLAEEPNVKITVLDLGDFSGSNRSISQPTLADSSPPKGSPVALTTRISVTGDSESGPVDVTAELVMYENNRALPVIRNGKTQRPKTTAVGREGVKIVPGGSSDIALEIPPMKVGTHHGMIRLIGDDALAIDDTRYFTVEVLPSSRVLLVAENAEEARVIKFMINATPVPVEEGNEEYAVDTIGYDDLPAVRLADFDSVILMDPPADVIADAAWSGYVSKGRGLLVCLGAAAGEASIESSSLPGPVRRWRSPDPHTFFEVVRPSHPVLAPLVAAPGGESWSDYRVQQYWQIEASKTDKVLMRFAGTDHPALIERDVKSDSDSVGRIVVCATPLSDLGQQDERWNDLLVADYWQAFLLVRNIAERISHRGSQDWTSSTGKPRMVKLTPIDPSDEPEKTRRLQIFPPGDAKPIPINIAKTATQAAISEINRSGTYWVRGAGQNIGFSANLPGMATDLNRIDPSALSVWFGPENYTLVTDQTEIELAEAEASAKVSLRSPLLLIALAVFLLEQILANRFYRRSSAGGTAVSSRKARAA